MLKLLAILTASAAVAGGATFAVFHHLDPNHCPLSGCEVTKPACCAVPPAEAASNDPAACVGSPALVDVSCCEKPAGLPCCAAAASRESALVVVVGPAAVR